MSREVYLDHAATTRPAPEVVGAIAPFLADAFGNPSSVHRRGEEARAAIEAARGRVAALIGATPEEIVFTATGSEANALALRGLLALARDTRRRVVTSAIEHNSVLENARVLEDHGFPVTVVPVERDGCVDPERFAASLGPDVALVSLMLVNNETGAVQPVAQVAEAARALGARVHCDAVQAAGKLPLDVEALGVDLLSIAAHKFGGVPGAAALYVRRRVRLEPLIAGGQQERSRRAGTENLAAIAGFGVAAERARARLAAGAWEALEELGERLERGLLERVPATVVHGGTSRLRTIVNVRFEGVDGEAVLHALDVHGIRVSTGSACSAASAGPSHVLTAMGLRPEDAHASVRFSLGEGNDAADVERVLETVPGEVARLRALAGAA